MRSSRTSITSDSQRKQKLTQNLKEIDEALLEMGCAPGAELSSLQAHLGSSSAGVKVVVGNSSMLAKRPELLGRITSMINQAYGYVRVDEDDIMDRLAMGDPGSSRANRVLHLAFLDDQLVGCMSSTFKVPWAERGCGHWGLLVVDVKMQGRGIASAMIAAAESRLAGACQEIQIEYEYTAGDSFSERLLTWYEKKCGFRCVSGAPRGVGCEWRKCRKMIADEAQQHGQQLRLLDIRSHLSAELAALESL
mmetsp:Transcript_28170/g.44058  ORF Transcript_28170/g.44058 Transcript_28170/m.44058 type:complete len:250 (+) Transcript_28170:96-845(+)|eukprot:CAMPEP_0169130962 /NCGR_PEP_ID=MMETSP1015-20121227/37993_1 /TAXON_ID=342587 /ORGANISM="Karlodinium micrum, Strain CCMP2283" /LENGTH=249 /DNA_ID=CAMNT_0009195191 /DNA_START=77 /DNA_END=826 /DNA_ORIENTATION=+